MSKFAETEYVSTKEILKFPDHYVALAVMVDDNGVVADENGKKIIKKGTIVGGATKDVLDNLDEPVVNKYVPTKYASLTTGTVAGDNSIVWTAVAGGTAGNDVSITIVDPGTESAALAITVSNKDISVALATGADTVETSTAEEVAAAINAHAQAKLLVKADASGNAVNEATVAAVSKTSLANGAAASATGAEGVLFNDVDVTYGDKEGAMIIHGFIAVDKLPYGANNAEAADTSASLLGMIKFIK
jgi:hypothetical protein